MRFTTPILIALALVAPLNAEDAPTFRASYIGSIDSNTKFDGGTFADLTPDFESLEFDLNLGGPWSLVVATQSDEDEMAGIDFTADRLIAGLRVSSYEVVTDGFLYLGGGYHRSVYDAGGLADWDHEGGWIGGGWYKRLPGGATVGIDVKWFDEEAEGGQRFETSQIGFSIGWSF